MDPREKQQNWIKGGKKEGKKMFLYATPYFRD